jgi:hypothetical protein
MKKVILSLVLMLVCVGLMDASKPSVNASESKENDTLRVTSERGLLRAKIQKMLHEAYVKVDTEKILAVYDFCSKCYKQDYAINSRLVRNVLHPMGLVDERGCIIDREAIAESGAYALMKDFLVKRMKIDNLFPK